MSGAATRDRGDGEPACVGHDRGCASRSELADAAAAGLLHERGATIATVCSRGRVRRAGASTSASLRLGGAELVAERELELGVGGDGRAERRTARPRATSPAGAETARARMPSSSMPASRSLGLDDQRPPTTRVEHGACAWLDGRAEDAAARAPCSARRRDAGVGEHGAQLRATTPMTRPRRAAARPWPGRPGRRRRGEDASIAERGRRAAGGCPSASARAFGGLARPRGRRGTGRRARSAFLSSARCWPMTPEARSIASEPTSARSETDGRCALGLDLRLRLRGDAGGLGLRLLLQLGDDRACRPRGPGRGCGRPRRGPRRAAPVYCSRRARPPRWASLGLRRCCPRSPRRARRAAALMRGSDTSR